MWWMLIAFLLCPPSAARPLAVQDLDIQLGTPSRVLLSWSAVSQDDLGQPLDCVYYEIHRGTTPWFLPTGATLVGGSLAPHWEADLLPGPHFFRVLAVDCIPPSGPDLLSIPAGTFQMGGPSTLPVHTVELTHDYLLGRTKVSNAEYLEALNWANAQGLVTVSGDYAYSRGQRIQRINRADMDYIELRYDADSQLFHLHQATWDNGAYGPGHAYPEGYDPGTLPVLFDSWYGAACYCDWRSLREGLPPYYDGRWSEIPSRRDPYTAPGYRLPTEAEWEYAARLPDGRVHPWGDSMVSDCAQANCYFSGDFCVGWTSGPGACPAGISPLGLEDLVGNAYEWVNDWEAPYTAASVSDPVGPDTGTFRIKRGGPWNVSSNLMRTDNRAHELPENMAYNLSFRVCRTLP
jgi:formylglycine-generating enzyme required for sulfatase activity